MSESRPAGVFEAPPTRAKVRAAYAWAAGGTFGAQGVFWILSLVVMNLLQPADYGLVGIITIFFSFCRTVQDAGLTSAIIQKPDLNGKAVNSAFWFFVAAGLLLTFTGFGAAPWVAAWKHEPRIEPLTRVMSLVFLIVALRTVPLALMTKALDFRRRTIAEISSAAVGSITTLTLAYLGYGVWSLVLGNGMAAELVYTLMVCLWSDWRPKVEFSGPELAGLLRFGIPQTLGTLLWQFYIDSDFLVIGLFLGEKALGLYTLSWQLAMVPAERLAAVLNKANFPVFSALMKEPEAVRTHFRTMVRTIAWVAFPASAGLLLVGPQFIRVMLRPKWQGAIPVLAQLSILGAMRAIGTILPHIISAAGKPKISFAYNAVCCVVYPIAFFFAARFWGAPGVGWAWVILYPMMSFWLILISIPRTPLHLADFFVPLGFPLAATACMAAAVVAFARFVHLSPLADVTAQIAVGVVVYGTLAGGWLWKTKRLDPVLARFRGRGLSA